MLHMACAIALANLQENVVDVVEVVGSGTYEGRYARRRVHGTIDSPHDIFHQSQSLSARTVLKRRLLKQKELGSVAVITETHWPSSAARARREWHLDHQRRHGVGLGSSRHHRKRRVPRGTLSTVFWSVPPSTNPDAPMVTTVPLERPCETPLTTRCYATEFQLVQRCVVPSRRCRSHWAGLLGECKICAGLVPR